MQNFLTKTPEPGQIINVILGPRGPIRQCERCDSIRFEVREIRGQEVMVLCCGCRCRQTVYAKDFWQETVVLK